MPPVRVNIGCSTSPTPGWLNYDASPSVKLARHPWLCFLLDKLGLLTEDNKNRIAFARNSDVLWADATKHIPLASGSVSALYSSHMLEHLDREEAIKFLAEARRTLMVSGVIRISVPDLRITVEEYCRNGDADRFIERISLAQPRPAGIRSKLKWLATMGRDRHRWMYDATSLSKLLTEAGFSNPVVQPAGITGILEPGELNSREREDESLYIEATKGE